MLLRFDLDAPDSRDAKDENLNASQPIIKKKVQVDAASFDSVYDFVKKIKNSREVEELKEDGPVEDYFYKTFMSNSIKSGFNVKNGLAALKELEFTIRFLATLPESDLFKSKSDNFFNEKDCMLLQQVMIAVVIELTPCVQDEIEERQYRETQRIAAEKQKHIAEEKQRVEKQQRIAEEKQRYKEQHRTKKSAHPKISIKPWVAVGVLALVLAALTLAAPAIMAAAVGVAYTLPLAVGISAGVVAAMGLLCLVQAAYKFCKNGQKKRKTRQRRQPEATTRRSHPGSVVSVESNDSKYSNVSEFKRESFADLNNAPPILAGRGQHNIASRLGFDASGATYMALPNDADVSSGSVAEASFPVPTGTASSLDQVPPAAFNGMRSGS